VQPILDILTRLSEADVSYVVVGGVAVVLQGHPRMTVDLDLALDLSVDNVTAALQALQEMGLRPRLPVAASDFADETIRQGWVTKRNLVAFTLHDPGDPLREVDLLAATPLPYETLARDATLLNLSGVEVPVASIDHLIELKQHSRRPQDLVDIEALKTVQRLRGDRDA
jgi:hypothetical protein